MLGEDPFVLGILVGEVNWKSPYVHALLETAIQNHILAFKFTSQAYFAHGAQRYRQGQILIPLRGDTHAPWTPLPDETPLIVYNRIPTRKEEASAVTRRLKHTLREQGIVYFNERFLNKREMDIVLRRDEEMRVLLPETLVQWDEKRFLDMLHSFDEVLIKPIGGSMGQGICRIAQEQGRYRVRLKDMSGPVTRSFDHWQDGIRFCHAQLDGLPFVVQEAIPLRAYDGCPTDFRVHLHKTDDQAWEVVAMAAKVGRRDAITTHVHSGGRIEDAQTVLKTWFGNRAQAISDEVSHDAVAVCQRLTQEIPGRFGELGLDMGIATDGRIVLFEANSKPGRSIFSHASLRAAGARSRRRVLEYADALAHNNESSYAVTQDRARL